MLRTFTHISFTLHNNSSTLIILSPFYSFGNWLREDSSFARYHTTGKWWIKDSDVEIQHSSSFQAASHWCDSALGDPFQKEKRAWKRIHPLKRIHCPSMYLVMTVVEESISCLKYPVTIAWMAALILASCGPCFFRQCVISMASLLLSKTLELKPRTLRIVS